MRALAQRLTTPYDRRPAARSAIGRAAAALSIGAGLIHVSAAVEHSDLPAMMVGFEVVALLQVALGALLILGRPIRLVLAGGIALMVGAVALWVISRTVGLGFLVAGAHAEPVGFKDGVTVIFELLAIGGLALLLEPSPVRTALPAGWLMAPRLGAAGAVACALFVPALLVGGHEHVVTHAPSVHQAGPGGPHLRAGHLDGLRSGRAHGRGHAGRPGRDHGSAHGGDRPGHVGNSGMAHGAHGSQLAVTHSHGAVGPVAPVHDHALASTGTVASASHGHTEGATTTGGGVDHGAHSPGHTTGSAYGSPPAEPAPPPEEPAPVLGDVEEEVDKLIP
jgi:hypothetical protein